MLNSYEANELKRWRLLPTLIHQSVNGALFVIHDFKRKKTFDFLFSSCSVKYHHCHLFGKIRSVFI